jgi:hypothetical protein
MSLLGTLTNYLLKGAALAGLTNGLYGSIRGKARNGFMLGLSQVLFFGLILFVLDFVVPRVLPSVVRAEDDVSSGLQSGSESLLTGLSETLGGLGRGLGDVASGTLQGVESGARALGSDFERL